MVRFVRIRRFAELTGYTVSAVEGKIAKGVFVEGIHYRRAPDTNICIDLQAYEKWVEGQEMPASILSRRRSPLAPPHRTNSVTRP